MPPKKKKEAAALAAHLRSAIGTFSLINGDEYTGEYQANARTKLVARHGNLSGMLLYTPTYLDYNTTPTLGSGTYTTWDGHRYTGMWENDSLVKNEPVNIRYADNSVYTGLLSNQMEYTGIATYQFYDGSRITGTFAKNVPTEGGLVFSDPSGAIWSHKITNEFLVIRHPNCFATEVAAAVTASQSTDTAPR